MRAKPLTDQRSDIICNEFVLLANTSFNFEHKITGRFDTEYILGNKQEKTNKLWIGRYLKFEKHTSKSHQYGMQEGIHLQDLSSYPSSE